MISHLVLYLLKTNAVAAVEEKEDSNAEFLSVKAEPHVRVNVIKQGDEITRIGNLDWDKELKHWVRRKPRGTDGTDEGGRKGLDGGYEVLAP